MAQRLVRAKQKIRNAGIPYRVPPAHLLPERTDRRARRAVPAVQRGLRGHAGADLVRSDLCAEAIRLARVLARLMPDEPEALGLLALMLLHDARRGTRIDAAGDLVTLEEQDRYRVGPGRDRRGRRPAGGGPAPRASRARTRSRPPSPPATPPRATAADTDWAEIAALYGELARCVPSPVVRAEPRGGGRHGRRPRRRPGPGRRSWPQAGELAGYHLLPATRADLLRRLDRRAEAAAAYREALSMTATVAEQRYLTRRLGEVQAPKP